VHQDIDIALLAQLVIRRLSHWQEGGFWCEISQKILEHWQAGRSIGAISRSLDVSGLPFVNMFMQPRPEGIVREIPRHHKAGRLLSLMLFRGRRTRLPGHRYLPRASYQEEIRTALATTKASTVWQRLRDEKKVKVSQPSSIAT